MGSPFAWLFPPWCLCVPSRVCSHISAPTPLREDLGKDVLLVVVVVGRSVGYDLVIS